MTHASSIKRPHRPFFNKQDVGLVYILPWFLGFLAFSLIPMVASLFFSFYDFNYFTKMRPVGLGNFARMFDDPDFFSSIKATFTFVVFAVPAKILAALLMAMLLNTKLKAINLYRTIFYLPSILAGSVAIGILWRLMYTKDGMINTFIKAFGLAPHNWLGDPKTAIYVLCLLPIWQFGSSMVIFLAALKQVPSQLYEAARIDGCGAVKQFRAITLPMLTPVILFNLVMQSINAFQEFSSAFVISGGGPAKTTYLYSMLIYDQAFTMRRMGYASALSWFLFAIILVFTAILFTTSGKWVFYEDGEGVI